MRYTRGAVAVVAAMSLLLAACSDSSDDESVEVALAAAEAEAEALQAQLDAVKAENEELSAALSVETDPDAEEATTEGASENETTRQGASEDEEPRVIRPDAVDVAERWGEALEARDSDARRALYAPEAEIVGRNYMASWTDVDGATERITNNQLGFADVELVRVEQYDELGPALVAEYEADVFWAPGDGDRVTFVVVFNRFTHDGLIDSHDIDFYTWSSFVTGEVGGHPQRTEESEEAWINVD